MTSSLHVSLPDEMRAYVDLRTNGKNAYATPSEYVRDLIRRDMEVEAERRYVFTELLKSADEIARGELISAEEVEADMDAMIAQWDKEEPKGAN
jgi:antitoxin ParD1/3/4